MIGRYRRVSRQQFRRYIRRFGPVEGGVLAVLGESPHGATLDELAAGVWGADRETWPPTWRASLRNAIARLRRKQKPIECASIWYLG